VRIPPQEPGREGVDLHQIADLGVGAGGGKGMVLVHVEGVLGRGAVDVAAGDHHELLHAVVDAVVEELLGAAHVHVVTQARVGPEVPDEAHVHDGGGKLGAHHVFELALAEIHPVHLHTPGMALPGHPIRPADLVVLQEPPRQEPALPSGDTRDEDLFHRFSKGLRLQGNPSARLHLLRGRPSRGI
jgi:hypothetical protein